VKRLPVATIAVCLLVLCGSVGCTHPTTSYNEGRARLISSHDKLLAGDRALTSEQFDRASRLYSDANRELFQAIRHFADAEHNIEADIRVVDDQHSRLSQRPTPADDRSVRIGTRTVEVDRYYIDSLRAYREALALAVVMRSIALTRDGEAHYRSAAKQLILGDQFYEGSQFAAAETSYRYSEKEFRRAATRLDEASGFIRTQTAEGRRLAVAAAEGVWENMPLLAAVAGRRSAQTDAYLATTVGRLTLARQVVAAYKNTKPGNIPDIRIAPLEPLPQVVRSGVNHPRIPSATLKR